MHDLDTQIRSYLDATSEPLTIDDVLFVPVGDAPVRPITPRLAVLGWRRGWLIAGAAAAVALGLLPFLFRGRSIEPAATTVPSATTIPITVPTAPSVPSTVAPTVSTDPATPTEPRVELVWTKADVSFREAALDPFGFPLTLVSDGDRFFTIIGDEVAGSVDGFVWEPLSISNMPPPERSDIADVDSAASKILLLEIEGSRASTVLIDTVSGEAHESILPFDPVGAVEDLRGFVALNEDGEAVALLYDLLERGIGETPAFHSADGINWTPIPEGQLPGGRGLQTAALGKGFVVTDAIDLPASDYWYSPDGRTWETAQADGALPGSLVSWGDAAISYVESAFGPQAFSVLPTHILTSRGGYKLDVDLPPLAGEGSYGPVVAAGGVGIAAFTSRGPEPLTWFVEYSPDGVLWVRQTLPFSGLNPLAGQPAAANADRVLVNVGGDIWVGTRP